MPELPEVETVRRCLEPILTGATIREVDVRRDRVVRRQPNPADVAARMRGRRVELVGRHGKFLEIQLDGDFTWIMHLGMSGRIALADATGPPQHTHFVVRHSNGPDVWFIDPRTFGFVAVYTDDELASTSLASLGPDALLDLPTSRDLGRVLANRTAPVKALLLDQRVVAGLGNIYADEVLHRARVDPRRSAGSLTGEEVSRIRRNIRPVLEAGIRAGGTSLNDLAYLLPDGRAGEFLRQLRVYGRTGEPCQTCGTPVERATVAHRSSHFCPRCQT